MIVMHFPRGICMLCCHEQAPILEHPQLYLVTVDTEVKSIIAHCLLGQIQVHSGKGRGIRKCTFKGI